MDENDFFQRASHAIHSSLDVETAMARCLPVLQEVMPARRMWLFLFDPAASTLRLIAQAVDGHGERFDQVVRLAPDAAADACRLSRSLDGCDDRGDGDGDTNGCPGQGLELVEDLGKTALSRQLREVFGISVGSYLAMLLAIEGKQLAYLAVSFPTERQYTREHGRLFLRLKAPFALSASHALQHREVVRQKALLDDDNRFLQQQLLAAQGHDLVGASEGHGLAKVMELVHQVADSTTPVLLLGETGVGKELLAKALHQASPRRDGPLVTVNCGAIPENLVDSELFGHEKGAFTGAVSTKRGRFERAHHGTLFLDELGELPPSAQVRLLRALQEKQIERVGATESTPIDVRIVAATHRDLPAMVAARTFREDLWFRLAVFPIQVPPLRARHGDVPALVGHFLREKARELRLAVPPLAEGSLAALSEYDWPGNVRELSNLIERALLLHRDRPGPLRPADLLPPSRSPDGPPRESSSPSPLVPHMLTMGPLHGASSEAGDPRVGTNALSVEHQAAPSRAPSPTTWNLDAVITDHIRAALIETDGRIHGPGGAAELLGVNASTLRARMGKLGVAYGKRRQRSD
jgi:transcriptional regulator with GAF, ATPase, and Fis domain